MPKGPASHRRRAGRDGPAPAGTIGTGKPATPLLGALGTHP